MKKVTRMYLLNWLDREYEKFKTRQDTLKANRKDDDIDRLMLSEEHWQTMMDYTHAMKRMIGKLRCK